MAAGTEEVDDLRQRGLVGVRVAVDADLEVVVPVGIAALCARAIVCCARTSARGLRQPASSGS
jgi:hypothetical protein